MTGDRPALARVIDTTKPSAARMYDYFLGGKDNYAVDREAAEQVLEVFPQARQLALANRRFLVRAVRYCAERGIDQFIDIGTGIPTLPNVPDVARKIQPHARVVGVDNDPIVLSHHRALIATDSGVGTVEGDVRRPDEVLGHPDLTTLIDLNRPVAVLLVALLHFVPDEDDPAGIVRGLAQHTAPGSYLVITAATSTDAPAATVKGVETVYQDATAPVIFRPEQQIRTWFHPFHLVAPGLVDVQGWRPDATERPTRLRIVGGVAYQKSWIEPVFSQSASQASGRQ
ncbi:MAG: SAM-dependent methyltransferase [Streptomycetales bacterium]